MRLTHQAIVFVLLRLQGKHVMARWCLLFAFAASLRFDRVKL